MPEQKPIPVAITLLKAHRHAGRNYTPGQTIRLAPHKADWLIAQSAAKPVETESAVSPAPPVAAVKPKKD